MNIDKKLLLYYGIFYAFLFLIVISFYFLNPFGNHCVSGDCENGNGIYLYHSGMKYSGFWKNNRRHGNGKLTRPDGTEYTGEWKNGRMHGQGMKISDDRTYTGQWRNGQKDGQGTEISFYRDEKGTPKIRGIYKGEWKNGQKNGQGTLDYKKSIPKRLRKDSKRFEQWKYTGEWENNSMSGYGTEYNDDGSVYRGEWKAGLKDGKGTLITPDGKVHEGEWVNNKMLQETKKALPH